MAIAERELNQIEDQDSRRFLVTKKQYYKMGAVGIFDDKRVELIEGEIFPLSPIGSRHAVAVMRITRFFVLAMPQNYTVSPQNSLDTSSQSEPLPDIAIISGDISTMDYREGLPKTAVLAIEIADITLRHDRRKADMYARAGIDEYWIVDLKRDVLEVYRGASGQRETPGSGSYAGIISHKRDESITPLALPGVVVSVNDLFP